MLRVDMRTYQDKTDAELLILIQAGDLKAFVEVYERYWAILLRHAERIIENHEDSKDIVQEVFIMLYKKGKEVKPSSTLSAFLFTSVRFRVLDWIDHSKIKKAYTNSMQKFFEQGEATTDQAINENELRRKIEYEVTQLPDKMKQVYLLSREEQLSYREISEILSISDKTVKKQVHYALKILRAKLQTIVLTLF